MVDPSACERKGADEARRLPAIIQGGMGAGVSHWYLARAAAQAGALGVVSGTALDRLLAYRLQDGDTDGQMRRVMATFPFPAIAERVLKRWYLPKGVARPGAYDHIPMLGHEPTPECLDLLVLSSYVEIVLAKEGHNGPIGINLLEKILPPNLAALYGAMLAGVDAVLMGAGIPREIPAALDLMAKHQPASLTLRVEGSLPGEVSRIVFSPVDVVGPAPHPPLRRPVFLAIITSDTLAQSLLRSTDGNVDGFVVESPIAGGHNAPPRGNSGERNARGEPIYGPRDAADLERLGRLGRPYWLAGGYGVPGGLAKARALGAQGVQVGTAFAFCAESGLRADLKAQVLEQVRSGTVGVFTDPLASPTGFPFKVVETPGTISEAALYEARPRICNLGYLRQAYRMPDGAIGWRCPAEPEMSFVAKGGDPAALAGRKCLCNALLATAGMPLNSPGGGPELPVITAGDDLLQLGALLPRLGEFTAGDVCRMISSP
ncbi:MAG TPA: 2-nitropropane dioxygenase [Planctomycetes bacterium]|nr:2-nitropropane dioxygenase [Planctomycetota bacterium]